MSNLEEYRRKAAFRNLRIFHVRWCNHEPRGWSSAPYDLFKDKSIFDDCSHWTTHETDTGACISFHSILGKNQKEENVQLLWWQKECIEKEELREKVIALRKAVRVIVNF